MCIRDRWWLLIATEGVYLGRRVVIWLYDRFAHRYDRTKNYYREYEQLYLARPIMEAIRPNQSPLVLDVATGTGRLPLALCRHENFKGRVIAADLSRRMLRQAEANLSVYAHQTALVWCPAENLPFPDDTFDVVTCLEALEFMVNPQAVIRELARVLRPGGLLLLTQRINTRLMPGKAWPAERFIAVFESCGIEEGRAQIWQVDYRKVWGRKRGDAPVTGVRPIHEILRCPGCGATGLNTNGTCLTCPICDHKVPVSGDGVIEIGG
jgi:ubiquinone/menaquinone biosynthesis C-methylase UbiE